jgi:hypothetical protein
MKKTPQEKAKELFKDMYTIIFDIDNGASVKHDQARYDAAKQAAIRNVNEILHNFGLTANGQTFYTEHRAVQYYQEAKQELEKL